MSAKLSEEIQVLFGALLPSTKDTLLYDTTSAPKVNWINLEGWHRAMVIIFRVAGTGSVQDSRILLASDVNGTGAISLGSSGSTECTGLLVAAQPSNDATGNRGAGMIVHDINVADLDGTLADGKYIAPQVSMATGGDDFGVCYVLSKPRYAKGTFTGTGRGTTGAGQVF